MLTEGRVAQLARLPLLVMGREQALDRLGGCSGQGLPALALAGSRAPLRYRQEVRARQDCSDQRCPLSQRATPGGRHKCRSGVLDNRCKHIHLIAHTRSSTMRACGSVARGARWHGACLAPWRLLAASRTMSHRLARSATVCTCGAAAGGPGTTAAAAATAAASRRPQTGQLLELTCTDLAFGGEVSCSAWHGTGTGDARSVGRKRRQQEPDMQVCHTRRLPPGFTS